MERKEAIEILKAYPLVIKDQQAIQEAIEMAISSLETDEAYQLEYEKPSGKWISVSERLPDTEDEVLCWYEYYHWSKEKILPEYGIGRYIVNMWYGEVSTGLNARVIAWQPLPEPYKMENEDNKYTKEQNNER